METGPKNKNELILPRGYTITELKSMPQEELIAVCEIDGLNFGDVQKLLKVSQVIESKQSKFEVTSVHPDQILLERLNSKLGTIEPKPIKIDLSRVKREVVDYVKEEEDAIQLVEQYEAIPWNATQSAKVQKENLKIQTLNIFTKIFLQKGLELYDKLISKQIPESSIRMEVVDMLLSEVSRGENVYDKVRGRDRALAYFGYNTGSQKELLAEFSGVVKRVIDRKADVSEQIQLNKLLRSAKGIFSAGGTTVNPGYFGPLLNIVADEYKISRPRNNMSAAAIQGSEIYEAGAYADNSYSRGHRPRRYGDGLGSN